MQPDKFLISPITGERVPAENMAEHMKISLLDPRWREQRDRVLQEKKEQEQVFAEGILKQFRFSGSLLSYVAKGTMIRVLRAITVATEKSV